MIKIVKIETSKWTLESRLQKLLEIRHNLKVANLNATLLNNLKLKKNIKVKSKDEMPFTMQSGLNEKPDYRREC
jgi:hypothetical protein